MSDERLTRVPQTIDQTFAHAKKDSAAVSSVRARYGFGDSTVVFIYLHKHRYDKRPLDVVKAFCQLDPGLDVGLLMCSDGPLRKEAEQYVQEHGGERKIHFTGYMDFEAFVNLVCASDVLVVTSEEPIGTVLYQALAGGLAILTSDRALCWMDVVKPGLNGLVFRSTWIESMVLHLRSLAENRALVESMKTHARQLSRAVSIEKSVSGVLEALKKLGLR